jgi:hypothetical protein
MSRKSVRIGGILLLFAVTSIAGAVGAGFLLIFNRTAPIGEMAVVITVPILLLCALFRLLPRQSSAPSRDIPPPPPHDGGAVVLKGWAVLAVIGVMLPWTLAILVILSSAVYYALGIEWAYSGGWKASLILLGTGTAALIVFSMVRTVGRAWNIRRQLVNLLMGDGPFKTGALSERILRRA